MQAGWFGDRYDHLKWSVLLRLASKEQAILYVAMLRGTDQKQRAIRLCDPSVMAYFKSLGCPCPKPTLERIVELDARIKLFATRLPEKGEERRRYFREVCELIGQVGRNSFCVFLDPDTGMAPDGSGKHVSYEELRMIWDSLRTGDRLVVYQHAWRPKGGEWHSIAQANLAGALGLDPESIAQEPREKTNVAFLTTVKQ